MMLSCRENSEEGDDEGEIRLKDDWGSFVS